MHKRIIEEMPLKVRDLAVEAASDSMVETERAWESAAKDRGVPR